MAEETKALSKSSVKVVYAEITKDIPEDKIEVQKLRDGYAVTVDYKESGERDGVQMQLSSSYFAEEHFHRRVKDVRGAFNERGEYEIGVDFEKE